MEGERERTRLQAEDGTELPEPAEKRVEVTGGHGRPIDAEPAHVERLEPLGLERAERIHDHVGEHDAEVVDAKPGRVRPRVNSATVAVPAVMSMRRTTPRRIDAS